MRDEQQAFLDAVLGRGEAPPTLTHAARGLPVYRGNAAALAAQALAVPFVRLHEAMGAPAFASLAWTFRRQCAPTDGDLAHWGDGLAAFLAGLLLALVAFGIGQWLGIALDGSSQHLAFGVAFWAAAYAFLLPPRLRAAGVFAGVAFGLLVGAVRMAQGAHFLSDVAAAGLIVLAVNAVFARIILRPRV